MQMPWADGFAYFDATIGVYELEYGKKYFEGCVLQDDKPVDISTAEKLYDYMVSQYED